MFRFLWIGWVLGVCRLCAQTAPVVSTHPADQIGYAGGAARFEVVASGTAPLAVKWQKDGADIPGASGTVLRLSPLTVSSAGTFRAVVSNAAGDATSRAASLAVRRLELDAGRRVDVFYPDASADYRMLPRVAGGFYVSGEFDAVEGRAATGLARLSAAGAMDPTFAPAVTGRPLLEFPDGRLLVLRATARPYDHEFVALRSDGSIDPGFARGIVVSRSAGGLSARWTADGAIMVAGDLESLNGVPRAGILRLRANGTLDPDHAPVIAGFLPALLPDGRAYVSTAGGEIVRLSASGDLDPGFAAVRFALSNSMRLWALPDGGLMVSGWKPEVGDIVHVACFNPDGSRKTAYVSPGVLSGSSEGTVLAVAAQGSALAWAQNRLYLIGPDGTAEQLLSDEWLLLAGVVTRAWSVPQGGFVVSSEFTAAAPTRFMRLSASGSVDRSFVVGLGVSGGIEHQFALPGGQTYLTGSFAWVGGLRRHRVARLAANGEVDPAFAPDPALVDRFFGRLSLADGALLLADTEKFYSGQEERWRRVEWDGRIDVSKDLVFGGGVRGASAAPDGSVLVGAVTPVPNGQSAAPITRIWPGGAGVDAAFAAPAQPGTAMAIAHAEDGRFAVAWQEAENGPGRITWHLEDGRTDTGRPAIDYTGRPFVGRLKALRFLPDGTLFAGGEFSQFGGLSNPGPYVRISPAGVVDSAFRAGDTSARWVEAEASPSVVALPGGRLAFVNSPPPVPPNYVPIPASPFLLTEWGEVDAGFSPTFSNASGLVSVAAQSPAVFTIAARTRQVDGATRHGLARYRDAEALRVTFPAPVEVREPGTAATLAVEVEGALGPVAYAWRRDGIPLPGATQRVLTLPGVSAAQEGRYSVIIQAGGQLVAAGPIRLRVLRQPVIDRPPQAATSAAGATAELSVEAAGAGPLQFQWQRNGVELPGETGAVLRLPNLGPRDVGAYRVIVQSAAGNTASAEVPVTVGGWRVDESYAPRLVSPVESPADPAKLATAALGLPDGKFLVAGSFSGVDGEHRPYLVRIDADGGVDWTFGPVLALREPVAQLWRTADGRIMARGTGLVALRADGSSDPGFRLDPAVPVIFAADPREDGRIDVVFGPKGSQPTGALSRGRLLPDGRLDPGFIQTAGSLGSIGDPKKYVPLTGGGWLRIRETNRLERLRPDGAPDNSYAAPPFNHGTLWSLLVDHSGRVYVSGQFTQCDGAAAHGLARLKPDGSFDRGFHPWAGFCVEAWAVAGDGRVLGRETASGRFIWLSPTLEFAGWFQPELQTLNAFLAFTPLADGRSHVVTRDAAAGGYRIGRLDTFGRPDASFLSPAVSVGEMKVLPQPSGKVVFAGQFGILGGPVNSPSNIMRLNADGSIDQSWTSGSLPRVVDAAIDGQGRLLYAAANVLGRLSVDGAVDSSFRAPAFAFNSDIRIVGVAAGNRVIVRAALAAGSAGPSLMRLSESGAVDPTFTPSSDGIAFALLSDGRLVKTAVRVPGETRLITLRSDGTPDARADLIANGAVSSLLPLPDGGYVAAGEFSSIGAISRARLAKITPGGAVDPAFQIEGPASVALTLPGSSAGDIHVRGAFESAGGVSAPQVARLTPAPFDVRSGAARIVVAPGAAASLSVAATGAGPYTYQWKKSGVAIAGATGATLEIAATRSADAGDYVCEVSSGNVVRASAPQVLGVGRAPRIVAALPSPMAVPATGATLAVTVDAEPEASFAWYLDGVRIFDANASSLAVARPGAGTSRRYEVVASNRFGTTRAATIVSGGYPPEITKQPAPLVATAGSSGTLKFDYVADPTPVVRWSRDGQPVDSRVGLNVYATSSELVFSALRAEDAGNYSATLTTFVGSVQTASVRLTVNPAVPAGGPVFHQHPTNQTVGPGLFFALSGRASDATSYQWLKDGVPVPGQTASTYVFGSTLTLADQGSFRLEARNSLGSALSNAAVVTVSSPPTIGAGPVQPLVAQPGAQLVLTANVTSLLPTAFQWLKDGVPIPGATSTRLVLADVQSAAAGTYRLDASNPSGTRTGAEHVVRVAAVSGPTILSAIGRSTGGMGADEIFGTFWIEGEQPKIVLIRALGASLGALNVAGGMPNPQLEVLTPAGVVVAANDDWRTGTDAGQLRDTMGVLRVYPTEPADADAVLQVTLNPGVWHFRARPSAADPRGGVILAELHDVPEFTFPQTTTRIAGLSLRTRVGHGADVAVLGFTLPSTFYLAAGAAPFVLRAAGPALGGGGVNPDLEIYGPKSELLGRSRRWQEGGATAAGPAQALGLAPFGVDGEDAAAAITLAPEGPFSLLVRAQPGGGRYALLEAHSANSFRSPTRAPAIVSSPLPQTTTPGGQATFSALWVAVPAATKFLWRKDGQPITGATKATLTLSGVQAADSGAYSLTVESPLGTAHSQPAALSLRAVADPHTADTGRDYQLNLVELTRVIELYNARFGGLRTGRYAVATNVTEDGFEPDRTATATALSRHHAADTDRDGRLSLVELTRVIELYNYRHGTARTGQYHAAAGTEDGFAPGP
jgi:uncharacterized delta-60 repeat protein